MSRCNYRPDCASEEGIVFLSARPMSLEWSLSRIKMNRISGPLSEFTNARYIQLRRLSADMVNEELAITHSTSFLYRREKHSVPQGGIIKWKPYSSDVFEDQLGFSWLAKSAS